MIFAEFDGLYFRTDAIVTVGPAHEHRVTTRFPSIPTFKVKFIDQIEQSFTYDTLVEAQRMHDLFVNQFCTKQEDKA